MEEEVPKTSLMHDLRSQDNLLKREGVARSGGNREARPQDDVEIDNKNVAGGCLRRRLIASYWQQPHCNPKGYRKDNDSNRFPHWRLLPCRCLVRQHRYFYYIFPLG